VNSLTSFIQSILNITSQSSDATLSVFVDGMDPSMLQQIKRYQTLAKATKQWVEQVTIDGLLYIEEVMKLYTLTSDKRKGLVTKL